MSRIISLLFIRRCVRSPVLKVSALARGKFRFYRCLQGDEESPCSLLYHCLISLSSSVCARRYHWSVLLISMPLQRLPPPKALSYAHRGMEGLWYYDFLKARRYARDVECISRFLNASTARGRWGTWLMVCIRSYILELVGIAN